MGVIENIDRIEQGKTSIISSIKSKGVNVPNNILINEIAPYINEIQSGGGGDVPKTELEQKYEGATVFRINVPTDNYEFAINLCNNASTATYDVDWGDGSLESGLTTDEQHHTYAKAGIYDINMYNLSKDITLGGSYTVSTVNNKSVTIYYLFNNTNNDSWGFRLNETKDNLTVSDILIGDKITTIGTYAFQYCSSLQSVVITEGVTTIGDYAFYNCSSLQSVVIPEGVTSISTYAFQYCSSLQSVVIPEGVTSISNSVFNNCSSLQSVVIPEGVTSIGTYAFQYCSSLQSVVIPEGVTSISNSVFNNCSSLQSVVIPEGVTTIGTYAFQNCYPLQSVVIPNSVTTIDSGAFSSCTSLQSVVISEGVTNINSNAFSSCTSLQSITVNALTAPTIKSNTFPTSSFIYTKRYLYVPKDSVGYNEGNWKTYLINKGWELRYIEEHIKTPTTMKLKTVNNFLHKWDCIGGANLVDYELVNDEYIYHFDDKIEQIRQYTFYNKKLKEIELPEGVTTIGSSTFSSCSSLQSVVIPYSVTIIGNNAFYNCSSLQSIELPEGVTSIDSGAFGSCTSLQSVVIPEGVTTIGSGAFSSCTSLQSVVIPNSVTTFGDSTFQYCSSLQSVVIPEGVTSISNYAFSDCSSLQSITVNAMTAPTIQSNTFQSVGTKVPSGTPKILRVPKGATGYDTGNWKTYLIDNGYTLEYIE